MNGTKAWYASTTIWGVLCTALMAILQTTGVDKDLAGDAGHAVTLIGELVGVIVSIVGRVRATSTIGGTTAPPTNGRSVSLNSALLAMAIGAACLGSAGCQSGNASHYYARAAATERVVLQAVITYDQTSAALGDTAAEKVATLAQCKVATDAIAALTDSLREASSAYEVAKASGDAQAMAEANDKALIAYRSLNAVATRLLLELNHRDTETQSP